MDASAALCAMLKCIQYRGAEQTAANYDVGGALLRWFQKRALGHPGLFPLEASAFGDRTRRADRWSVGAAVTATENRTEPIVETNFEHLNVAARRESVSQERPRPKR